MKWASTLLPLAALSSAFVIPDEEQVSRMLTEQQAEQGQGLFHEAKAETHDLFSATKDKVSSLSHNAVDAALHAAEAVESAWVCRDTMTAFDGQGWLDSALEAAHDLPSIWGGKHGKHGGHHHHHKPNKTVYELINESKYTTRLAELINKYDDIVEALNGTAANYTVFAPTDKAFKNALKHHDVPDRETLKMILAYHVSADFYPAGRVLVSHTIPTTYGEPELDNQRQRLRVGLGWKGLAVNFYARIIAIDIFGTNGVIHGIDHVLFPPPKAGKVLSLLPADFSTLILALEKTGIWEHFHEPHAHPGTLFAPSNFAFKKLGPKINMFLFSEHGKKYLKALLQYHLVPNHVLYSDAYYTAEQSSNPAAVLTADNEVTPLGFKHIPKGKYSVTLPTALDGKSIHADIARFGGIISIKLNGFNTVDVQDGICKDGVVHKLDSILLPPKTPGGFAEEATEDLTVEELVARLDGWKADL